MALKRHFAYGAFLLLAGVLVYFMLLGLGRGRQVSRRACLTLRPELQDRAAPPFELPDLAGGKRSLGDLRGKLVLLHFWATWCRPCLEELPSLYRLRHQLTDRRFELVTVSVDDSLEVVRRFFDDNKLPALPVLLDEKKKVAGAYGTKKFPESYLIDGGGVVRQRFVNRRDWGSPAAIACIRSLLD